jgi:hypothetical protein
LRGLWLPVIAIARYRSAGQQRNDGRRTMTRRT